jgi:hypothetical protein
MDAIALAFAKLEHSYWSRIPDLSRACGRDNVSCELKRTGIDESAE